MATLTYRQTYTLARSTGLNHERAVEATAIAKAESDLDTDATGDTSLTDETWGPSLGLWQVRSLNDEYGTGRPRDGSRLTDPEFNARSMYAISGGGSNWSPWSVFTSGSYRAHLSAVNAAVGSAADNPPGGITPAGWPDLPGGDWDIPGPSDLAEGAAQQVIEWVAKPALIAVIVAAGFVVVGVGLWRASAPTPGGAS